MKKQNKKSVGIHLFMLIAVAGLLFFSATAQGQIFWTQAQQAFGLETKPQSEAKYPLNIYCLSVGKADAIVISCEGEYALLDGATFDQADEVSLALQHLGVKELTAVFASHPDADHIGGLPYLLSAFPTKQYIQPNFPFDLVENNEEQTAVIDSLQSNAVPLKTARVGDVFTVGTAKIEVLGPIYSYASTNNFSLILKLTYGDFSMLFCGDVEKRAEEDLLAEGVDLQADCLKIAHHGSKTSSSEAFLAAVNAKYAVVSTGADRNKLPRGEVLKRVEKFDMTVYRTDLDGMITISSDGQGIWIVTEKEQEVHEKINN